MQHTCKTFTAAMTLLLASLVASACGGTSSSGQASLSRKIATRITCNEISADLGTVIQDEKTEQAQEQEAWVTGGKVADLQTLINDTNSAAPNGNQLNQDAATFNDDANSYLSQNSPVLAPGWENGYNTVWSDINALAGDCNQSGAGPVMNGM